MEGGLLMIMISFYVIIVAWNRYDVSNSQHIYVKSQYDGNYYHVQKKFSDHQQASDLLSNIKKNLDKLITHLALNHPKDPRTLKILQRFDTVNIMENETENKFTSYTQNKGEKMVFCLRTRDEAAKLHPINLLMFVAIHELSHVSCDSIGHDDPEFWINFAFLLRESLKIKVWKYIDFKKNPATYCGMRITNSVV